MKILLVVAYYIPEIGSAAHVYHDLARGFVRNGHEVHIITSYPRQYNMTEEDRNEAFPYNEVMDGVFVHRVQHDSTRDNIILRGLEHFIIPRQYYRVFKEMDIIFDACIIYIPPLPLCKFASKIKKFNGTPSILNFQDFHPQEMVDVGVMRNRVLIQFFERMERKAYKNADYITVLSSQGIKYVMDRGGTGRISHVYNSVDLEEMAKYSEKKDFKVSEKIEDKILVSYAGILSFFQGLDSILDAASMLKDPNDYAIYIVGDGMKRADLEKRIKNEKIGNVRLVGMQQRSEYFNIVNSSDISLIALDGRMRAPCLPGKLLNLMAMGQPIVAVVPEDSATANLVKAIGCGVIAEPNNPSSISAAIDSMASDEEKRREMGLLGRRFVEREMDLNASIEKYEEIIVNIRKTR